MPNSLLDNEKIDEKIMEKEAIIQQNKDKIHQEKAKTVVNHENIAMYQTKITKCRKTITYLENQKEKNQWRKINTLNHGDEQPNTINSSQTFKSL